MASILEFLLHPDFILNGGCFGTDIIQNCTKWSNIGVHGLSYGPFVAKLRCASFLFQKNEEKWQYGPKKHKIVDFREKNLWEATCLTPTLNKNKSSDIIYSNLINLIIDNQI